MLTNFEKLSNLEQRKQIEVNIKDITDPELLFEMNRKYRELESTDCS